MDEALSIWRHTTVLLSPSLPFGGDGEPLSARPFPRLAGRRP